MTTQETHRSRGAIVAVTLAALIVAGDVTGMGPLMLGGEEAHAVVGRPLTPVSYAGVARRTSRRTTRRTVAATTVATPGVITTLPAGCTHVVTSGATIYTCGAVRYRPYYDGPTVVYRPI